MGLMAAMALVLAQAGAGAAPAVRFDPADRAYRTIAAIERTVPSGPSDSADARELAAARATWTALRDRASAVRVRGTALPHPFAGRASFVLAQIAQIEGSYALSETEVTRALTELGPFAARYRRDHAGALVLLGFLRTAAGKSAEAVEILARAKAAQAAYTDGVPPARRTAADHVARAEAAYAYGQALARVGRLDEAVAEQRLAVAALTDAGGENGPDTLIYAAYLANLLYRAEQRAEADRVGRDAVERVVAAVGPAKPAYSNVLVTVGLLMTRNGHREEGLRYLSLALASRRRIDGGRGLNFLQQQQGYGLALIEAGRTADAIAPLQASLEGFRALQSPYDVLKAQSLVGLSRLAEGDTARAVADLGAVAAGSATRDPATREVTRVTLPALVVAEVDAGEHEAARRHAALFAADAGQAQGLQAFLVADAAALCAYAEDRGAPGWRGRAVAAAQALIDTVRGTETLVTDGNLPRRERMALDLALRIAAEAGDPALALDAMGLLAGSRIAQANHLLVERLVATEPGLATRIRLLQDATRAAVKADTDYLAAVVDGPERAATARGARDAAAAQLAEQRAGVAHDYPRWTQGQGLRRQSLAAVQAGLATGEGMLGVVPAFDGVYLLAIARDRATVVRASAGRAALDALTGKLRLSLAAGAFDTAAAADLHAALFPATVRATLAGVSRLRVVPVGSVAALPFATLLEHRVERPGAAAPWLIRRYALSVASDFGSISPVRAGRAAGRLLAIGAPAGLEGSATAAAGRYFRGSGGADGAMLRTLPPLAGAAAEIDRVVAGFGTARATRLTGAAASEAGLRALPLDQFDVLLFATHGLVAGEMEGVAEPALVLTPNPAAAEPATDGLLTASEIAALRLDADWVILSACNTAAGDGAASPAYSGLAQAFRYAGARSLLLTHWPVRDDVAAQVSVETVQAATAGAAADVALRRAMLRAMRRAPDPYTWAPFILAVGG